MAVAPIYSFLTIQSAAEGIYKEKGSKFLSFAFPIQTEAEVKSKLEELKKKYFDANHHCYAWMLGADKKHFRAFDDGEPNHSAGSPILGQIKSRNLTNVLIVVVRFFGGTKLGVGGLTQAYKTAADYALQNAIIREIEVAVSYTLKYDYASSAEVMKLVKDFELKITAQNFESEAEITINVNLKAERKLLEKLKLLLAMGVKILFSKNINS